MIKMSYTMIDRRVEQINRFYHVASETHINNKTHDKNESYHDIIGM